MHKLILMMGGQGSGKGTLSQMMMDEHKYNYIETGAILRALPDGHKLKEIAEHGDLVPDTELYQLLSEKITPGIDTIIDGFPRQLSQAKWLVDTFSNKFEIIVIYLNMSRDLMIKRIKHRIAAGGGRPDDADETAVQHRLNGFFEKTLPAIEWMKTTKNVKFVDVPIADAPAITNYKTLRQNLKRVVSF